MSTLVSLKRQLRNGLSCVASCFNTVTSFLVSVDQGFYAFVPSNNDLIMIVLFCDYTLKIIR